MDKPAPITRVLPHAWTWPCLRACLRCGFEYLARAVTTPCPRCRFVEAD